MDPVTAGLLALKALFEMITEIVKGQPSEVKVKEWERWERFIDAIAKITGIDKSQLPQKSAPEVRPGPTVSAPRS